MFDIYTKKFEFGGATSGSSANGSFLEASDGMLYGLTTGGGSNDDGVLFEYNPLTNTYTKKIDFVNLDSMNPIIKYYAKKDFTYV